MLCYTYFDAFPPCSTFFEPFLKVVFLTHVLAPRPPSLYCLRSTASGRVKKNVHVTLAFSPVGDSFRNRLRHLGARSKKTVDRWTKGQLVPWMVRLVVQYKALRFQRPPKKDLAV